MRLIGCAEISLVMCIFLFTSAGRYWEKLAEERRRNPNSIWLADKNAPNEDVWITVSVQF